MELDLVSILVWIIIGGLAGWLAGMVMKVQGGLVFDIVVGIIGAFLGGFIFNALGIGAPADGVDGLNLGSFVVAFIGAVVLLGILRLIRRA